ncbi:MAG: glycerate kinase [Chloroflexi bacterium]|nr:glycerate kinase [Chloroflexota bacterium]
MRVLFAPDSFKGSLSSVEVARALAAGWQRARPADEVLLAPLADGGEGTLAAIEAAGGWSREVTPARDPLGRWIEAPWLLERAGRRAVVELATASGLSRLAVEELDPVGATTHGTGDLLLAAVAAGARHVVLGIGGSATTDGGRGIVEALGGTVAEEGVGGAWFVDLGGLDGRLREVTVEVACDVTNPLLGETGAAATYGPQKGATPEQVAWLDSRNGAWADALEAATSSRHRDDPGAGAAGGVGFALLCLGGSFAAFALRPGIELVMESVGFAERLAAADLVVTGEGRIDAQTAFGKTALGVARLAREARVRCLAVGGGVEPEGREALARLGCEAVPVWERPVPLAQAMAAGAAPLVECGARMAAMQDDPSPATRS